MSPNEYIPEQKPDDIAEALRRQVKQLWAQGRTDLLLKAIGVPLLEELRIEAARGQLSPLLITKDYRFVLTKQNKEVELQPVHKAVYLLFLAHPEGIEFKRLSEHRNELRSYYMAISRYMDKEKIEESINHLVNPLDNAIHEKCSRIKQTFLQLMDEYSASYYIISGNIHRHSATSDRIWYKRMRIINLPRELVIYE